MKIPVTHEDIEKGIGGDCWACPIAIALNRMFGDREAYVTADQAEFYVAGERPLVGPVAIAYLPVEAGNFVNQFDEYSEWGTLENDDARITFIEDHGYADWYDYCEDNEDVLAFFNGPDDVFPFEFEVEVEELGQ